MNILKIKTIIAYLNIPRLIPHIFLFLAKRQDCQEDVVVNMRQGPSLGVLSRFLVLMVWDKFFRELFYHRIGKWRYFISFLAPPHPCFFIAPDTKIGKGFLCGHPFSTTINANSIGNNVAVFQDVTIGINRGGRPTIGNCVHIYTNSVVIGDIIIGDNVSIGACSLVNKDVPSNCTVVGNPARIIILNNKKVNIPL